MSNYQRRPRLSAALLVLALVYSGDVAAQVPEQSLPRTIEQLIRQAVESQPLSTERPDPKEANLSALNKLKNAPWPNVRSFQRLRITTKGERSVTETVWLVSESESELMLLYDDFSVRPLPRDRVERREAVEYLSEVQTLLARHETAGKNDYVASNNHFREGYLDGWSSRPPLFGDAVLVLHAYCTAVLGHEAEFKKLLAAALTRHPSAIDTILREWSWSSFQSGIELLESGAPRRQVLQQWQQTLKGFPASEYTEQLKDYLPQLEMQVAEDGQRAKSVIADPELLPPAQRITYYTERFPDVHGTQFSQPGHCTTYGLGEPTKFSDAVIAIGLPAVPALIDRLEDRRLTRSVGFSRNFSPHRIVLRVQDVAIQAIQQIVSERFYEVRTTSSYFSTETADKRAEIIAAVKTWWKDNSAKSPLEMHLSRRDEGRAYERIDRLRKILKLDPKALDEAAILKRWAGQIYSDDMCEYAEALARLNDLSLLPIIRERALDRVRLPATYAIWYLTRHGNASDYRILREIMLNERKKGADGGSGNSPFGAISGGACESKNPLAAPLLVDLLSERKGDYSLADRSFVALSAMTGHDVGYTREASRDERNSAIDRWIEWWNREGQEQFLVKHSRVGDVIAERKLQFSADQIAALPALVSVSDANEQVPVTFDVPRRLLPILLNAGRIAASEDARGQPVFRFTSPQAGLEWFDSAEPVDADDDAGKKLIPAMRTKTRGLTRPDSIGRVWCTWDRALSPIAVFDGNSWKSFAEPLPPGRVDNPIGFISVFQGAAGAMVFLDRNHHFHLFDGAGHLHAESATDLFLRHSDRVQRALPQPCSSSDAFYFHLVKDDLGRVWWSNWETDWGVIDGANVIRAGDAIPTVNVTRGYRQELLFPASRGQVFVFSAGNVTRGALAELFEGKVTHVSDLPTFDLDNRQNSILAIRDRKGRVWLSTRQGSKALDSAGKIVAEHRGRILMEDRDGGLWFHMGSSTEPTSLARLSRENQESVLALPRLRPFWPLAESPDGTFWAISGTELVQIHCRDDQLTAGVRLTVPQSNYLWCDNQGRVWLTGTGREEQAIRLAVGKPLSKGVKSPKGD